jgi:hypothetical protein
VGNGTSGDRDLTAAWAALDADGHEFWREMETVVDILEGLAADGAVDV